MWQGSWRSVIGFIERLNVENEVPGARGMGVGTVPY